MTITRSTLESGRTSSAIAITLHTPSKDGISVGSFRASFNTVEVVEKVMTRSTLVTKLKAPVYLVYLIESHIANFAVFFAISAFSCNSIFNLSFWACINTLVNTSRCFNL